jgi:hypothetical protein
MLKNIATNAILSGTIASVEQKIKNITDPSLLLYILDCERRSSRRTRKGIERLIDKKMNPKKNNGAREKSDINCIVDGINSGSSLSEGMIKTFKDQYNQTIIKARKTSSRKQHNDFEILIKETNQWKKIEHKGSRKLKNISDEDKPWSDSCQFYNGDPKPFSICQKYINQWWDEYIASGYLIDKYELENGLPTFEEWSKDAFRQGKPKTAFLRELRSKSKQKNGVESLFKERKSFNRNFNENITQEDLDLLMSEIQPIYKNIMKDKQYWLKINGDIHDKFNFMWFQNTSPSRLVRIECIQNKLDPMFRCFCDDGSDFVAHLRWGYNQGIANLRLDFK